MERALLLPLHSQCVSLTPPSNTPAVPPSQHPQQKTKQNKNTKYSRDECACPVQAGVAGERLRRCRIYLHESEKVRECLSVYTLC